MPEPPPRRTPEQQQQSQPSQPTPPPSGPKKKRKKPGQRTIWTYVFYLVIVLVVAFGIVQFAGSFFSDKEPALGDHIHAALVVDICGVVQDNAPTFAKRAGSGESAGIHSHNDGLMHIHPEADDEVGGDATVGKFFEEGGWGLSEDRIDLAAGPNRWSDINVTNGDPCPDGQPGKVRFMVNGTEQDGNPGDFAPDDGDRIVIFYLPDGAAPPAEQDVISDDVGATLASALEGKSVDQNQQGG